MARGTLPPDMTGRRFARLTAIERVGKTRLRAALWRCLCDCGNETIVTGVALRSGNTKSCGCLVAELGRMKMIRYNASDARRNGPVTHGATKGRTAT